MTKLDEYERQVWRLIQEMRERHAKELEPLMRRLTEIQACRPPAPICIRVEDIDPAVLAKLQRQTARRLWMEDFPKPPDGEDL